MIRKIVEINEVKDYDNSDIQLNKIYELQEDSLVKTGKLINVDKLKRCNLNWRDM